MLGVFKESEICNVEVGTVQEINILELEKHKKKKVWIIGGVVFAVAFVFTYILNKAETRKKKMTEVTDNE